MGSPFPTSIPGVTGFPDMVLPEGPTPPAPPAAPEPPPASSMLPPGVTGTTAQGFPAGPGVAPFEIGPQAIGLPQGGVLVPTQFPDGQTFSLPPANAGTTPVPGVGGAPASSIPFPVVGSAIVPGGAFVTGPQPTFAGVPLGAQTDFSGGGEQGSVLPPNTTTGASAPVVASSSLDPFDPNQGTPVTETFQNPFLADNPFAPFQTQTTTDPTTGQTTGQTLGPQGTISLGSGASTFWPNFFTNVASLFTRFALLLLGVVLLGVAAYFMAKNDAPQIIRLGGKA